jgi:omega-amidase
MKITIVQSKIFWEDRTANLKHFEHLISKIKSRTDLIVLPEMFTTGFTMNPEMQAEKANTVTLDWMKKMAKKKSCAVMGSVSTTEGKKHFNRLYYVESTGKFSTYDKRHLFRMAKEDEHYSAGKKKLIVQNKDWNICTMICYDLRFPVWSRNKYKSGKSKGKSQDHKWDYDVLIYVANWPQVRAHPWKQLLVARAIENQCYVVGVNRIGKDGNGFDHSGDSMVVDPRGNIISQTKAGKESVETLELNRIELEKFRKVFPVGMDADEFKLL